MYKNTFLKITAPWKWSRLPCEALTFPSLKMQRHQVTIRSLLGPGGRLDLSQARILEWVVISSSRGSSWPRDGTCVSCIGRWILYHCDTWEAILYYIWLYCSVCVCVLRWAFQNHQIQPACSGRLKLLPLPRTIHAQGSSSSPSTVFLIFLPTCFLYSPHEPCLHHSGILWGCQ